MVRSNQYGKAGLVRQVYDVGLYYCRIYILLCGDVFALVDDNSNKITTKIILFPSKYKYEYKLYARQSDTPTCSELSHLCSCCMQQVVHFDLLHAAH